MEDKIKHLEDLLKAASIAITDSGHEMENCEGAEACFLCETQQNINEYFEN